MRIISDKSYSSAVKLPKLRSNRQGTKRIPSFKLMAYHFDFLAVLIERKYFRMNIDDHLR